MQGANRKISQRPRFSNNFYFKYGNLVNGKRRLVVQFPSKYFSRHNPVGGRIHCGEVDIRGTLLGDIVLPSQYVKNTGRYALTGQVISEYKDILVNIDNIKDTETRNYIKRNYEYDNEARGYVNNKIDNEDVLNQGFIGTMSSGDARKKAIFDYTLANSLTSLINKDYSLVPLPRKTNNIAYSFLIKSTESLSETEYTSATSTAVSTSGRRLDIYSFDSPVKFELRSYSSAPSMFDLLLYANPTDPSVNSGYGKNNPKYVEGRPISGRSSEYTWMPPANAKTYSPSDIV